jgi:serine/threonine-protein kinase RsbW
MQPGAQRMTTSRDPPVGEARVIRLSIPAKPEYITLGRLALTGLAGVRSFTPETLADLKLALTEACSNSVRHAYGSSEDGHVEIVYELAPEQIAIEVVDDGEGFDPAVEGDLAGGDLSEGGLGIAIIRAIADEFEIESSAGTRGSRLRFVKVLDR